MGQITQSCTIVRYCRTITISITCLLTTQREARDHFNCSSLAGLELENQGGSGTALSHWEKRILGVKKMHACVID